MEEKSESENRKSNLDTTSPTVKKEVETRNLNKIIIVISLIILIINILLTVLFIFSVNPNAFSNIHILIIAILSFVNLIYLIPSIIFIFNSTKKE